MHSGRHKRDKWLQSDLAYHAWQSCDRVASARSRVDCYSNHDKRSCLPSFILIHSIEHFSPLASQRERIEELYAQKTLDTADIVRDRDLSESTFASPSCRLRST